MNAPVKSAESTEKKRDAPQREHSGAVASASVPVFATALAWLPGAARLAGNQAVQRLFRSGAIQAKLSVSQPGDRYEQEADRLAERVTSASAGVLQRKCACGGGAAAGGECEECNSHAHSIQRQAVSGGARAEASHESVGVPGSGSGRPLDSSSRAFMESRFGYDFGGVRVHTDARAAESARALNARAYTFGRDVVFAAGEYAPGSAEGRRLLAHELTHVVQQSGAAGAAQENLIQRQTPGDGKADGGGGQQADGGQGDGKEAPAKPEQTVPKAGSKTVPYGEIVLSDDREFMRFQMHNLIRKLGLKGADGWFRSAGQTGYAGPPLFFPGHLSATPALRPRTPLDAIRDEQRKKEKEQEQRLIPILLPIAVEVYTEIRAETVAYLKQFEAAAKLVLGAMLQTSEERVTAEQERYGVTETYDEVTKVSQGGAYKTRENYRYGMANNAGAKGLKDAANELKGKAQHLLNITNQRNGLVSVMSSGGDEVTRSISNQPLYDSLGKQIEDTRRQYNLLRNEKQKDYPIIGSFSELPEKDDGTYYIESLIDSLSEIGKGPSASLAKTLHSDIAEKLKNIEITWDALNTGKLEVWTLEAVIGTTKNQLGVKPGSLENKVVDENAEGVATDAAILKAALGAVALALGLLAAIPTGGSSLVAAGAFVAGAGAAGVSVYTAQQSVQEYIIKKAAKGTDFDKAQAISQEDPSLFWLALDIVGAVLDINTAVESFHTLLSTARAAMMARRAAKTAAELVAADKKLLQLAEEAEHVKPGLGKRVSEDLAAQAGRKSPHLDSDFARFEGEVNQQTRGYLVDHPDVRANFKEMDPEVRDLFTHCSPENCLITQASRRDAARVRGILDKLPPEAQGKLKEYFHLRKDDLQGAIKELEEASKAKNSAERVGELIDDTFKRLEQSPGGLPAGTTAKQVRNAPGVVTGSANLPHVTDADEWLKATGGGYGLIPGQVADKLQGRSFKTFDELREAFWEAVGQDAVLSQGFSASNVKRITGQTSAGKILAPIASKAEQYGKIRSLALHHIVPIEKGGAVYDLSNLVVVSPRYHYGTIH